MNVKPIGDLIIIEKFKSKTETAGGILLPIPNQKSVGKVLAVGKGVFNKVTGNYDTIDVNVGDVIIFQTHRGHNYIDEETKKDFLFLSMNNILGVYKKEDIIQDGELKIDVDDTVMCLGH